MMLANGVYKEIWDGAILIKVKVVIILASTWHKLGREILPFHWLSFFSLVCILQKQHNNHCSDVFSSNKKDLQIFNKLVYLILP